MADRKYVSKLVTEDNKILGELKLNTWEIMKRWYDLLKEVPEKEQKKICTYISEELEDLLYEYDNTPQEYSRNELDNELDPDAQSGETVCR